MIVLAARLARVELVDPGREVCRMHTNDQSIKVELGGFCCLVAMLPLNATKAAMRMLQTLHQPRECCWQCPPRASLAVRLPMAPPCRATGCPGV